MLGVSMHHHHADALGWTLDPVLLLPLVLTLAIFLTGWWRLSKRAANPHGRPGLFLAGWTVLTLSLVSPLHEAGEQSFTMHMIEHELIMLVATLLLAASAAGGIMAWGLPRPLRLTLG
jgi:putative membrane protein